MQMLNLQITDNLIEKSFLFSYLALFGLTLITFIEALKTENMRIRHILNLETSVSLVAGFVYGIFYDMLQKKTLQLDKVTEFRYMDWAITTPMLLLVLLLFLNFDNRREVHFSVYFTVLLLNYTMLIAGFLGETKTIDKNKAGAVGFIAYFAMITFIWYLFIHNNPRNSKNNLVFTVFTILWSFYGIAYYTDVKTKNLMYNTLDVMSKAMFGILIWLYYGKVISFSQ